MQETILTQRLILTGWENSDAPELYEILSNPETALWAAFSAHKSEQDSLRLIQSYKHRQRVWAVRLKQSGRLIGTVGLHRDLKRDLGLNSIRMLSYLIDPKYQRAGYAQEAAVAALHTAFCSFDLMLVSACCYCDNKASAALLKKLGFTLEGTLRKASQRGGMCVDECCFSITRQEYFMLYGAKQEL